MCLTPHGVARPPRRGLAGQGCFLRITLIKTALEPPRGRPFGGGDVHRIRGYRASAPMFVILSIHVLPTKKQRYFGIVKMFLKKLGRSTGVSPPPFQLPQNAIPPEKVIGHHRSQRRAVRMDRHCPLLILPVLFISTPDKRNSYENCIIQI